MAFFPLTAAADAAGDVAAHIKPNGTQGTVNFETLHKAPSEQVLAVLRQHALDPDRDVRMGVLGLARATALWHPQREVQRQAARLIFDIGNWDEDEGLGRYAGEKLLMFSREDFSDDMRQVIHRLLHEKPPSNIGHLMLLAGVADVPEARGRLRELADLGHWSANLALARLGDPVETQRVIDKATGEEDVLQRLSRLRDLAYTRQPEAIAVLVNYLFSEEKTPGDGDAKGVRYAVQALDSLTQIIEEFPVNYQHFSYSIKDIEIAREWIMQQGVANLQIKR